MAHPVEIEQAAARYDQQADELTQVGRRSWRRVDGSSWTCARADRARDDAYGLQRESDVLAQDLRSLAADMRAYAARKRAEIETAELRVRAYLASPEAALAAPVALPPSGDPSWPAVAAGLGLG